MTPQEGVRSPVDSRERPIGNDSGVSVCHCEPLTVALPGEDISRIATWLRLRAFEVVLTASNGHLGAAGSSAELFAALYFGSGLRLSRPGCRAAARDRVLVRGHLGPIRYPLFSLLGHVRPEELNTYRQFGSRLQGHEDHLVLDAIDISPSGSLGMLLSYAVGALVTAEAQKHGFRAFVFLGDGEEQEGNVGEAARHAAHLGLSRLVAILDRNGKQLSCSTDQTCSADIAQTWRGYGWQTLEVDGHDVEAILSAFKHVDAPRNRPLLIIANTQKGRGLEGAIDHISGYHTLGVTPRNIVERAAERLRAELGHAYDPYQVVRGALQERERQSCKRQQAGILRPVFDLQPTADTSSDPTAAQTDYFLRLGSALKALTPSPTSYFLTADVTYYSTVSEARISENMRFFNVGLREQHMLAMAHGISITEPGAVVFINTSDAFTYRGMDQLNAAAQGRSRIIVIGDVAGLTEGRNGRSHQTSGQPGALIAMPGLVFLEPGDTSDLFSCLNWAISSAVGPVFVRVSRGAVPSWARGASELGSTSYYKAYWPSVSPSLIIVASGLPVRGAIDAAILLRNRGISIGVINVIQQNSLDAEFARELVDKCTVLTVYNGHPDILRRSVATSVFSVPDGPQPRVIVGLGFEQGTSGAPIELITHFGLDAERIAERAVELIADD